MICVAASRAHGADATSTLKFKTPAGEVVIPADVGAFAPAVYVTDRASARIDVLAGAKGRDSLRLTTLKPAPQSWQIGVNARTTRPVRKGDVLWVHFASRRLESRAESGEAIGDVTFLQKDGGGKEVRPLERSFSCGPDWVETCLPFVIDVDSPAGEAKLSIRFGGAVQSFEIADVTLLNCGPVDVATLPRTETRYEGHAADAPWRAAAAARIEKYRKGDLTLHVVDAAGRPVAGAQVAVRMRRHAFAWGTAVDSRRLVVDTGPDADRYRQTVETYFNKVVFENELKWGRWITQKPADRQNILSALDWLDARHIAVRGHVMVWPSWKQTPRFLHDLEQTPEAVRAAVLAHIDEQTAVYGKRLAEWDVINETFIHKDLMNLLGRGVMIDWFKRAHAGAPGVKLFYNDFVMFHGSTPDSPSQYFFDTVKFLIDQGAPISGIGEQGHFGGNPPGPGRIIAQLDRFATLGLPIQITEFDVETPDDQLAADFTRDFTTAVFSHPAVTGMVQWGFWAPAHWKPAAALWRKDWSLRPAGQAWVNLVSKTWWTNADGRTDSAGTFQTRGFYGDYDVTVTQDDRRKAVRVQLAPGVTQPAITLPRSSNRWPGTGLAPDRQSGVENTRPADNVLPFHVKPPNQLISTAD